MSRTRPTTRVARRAHPRRLGVLLAGAAVIGLGGCATSLSGVGSTSGYGCRAPAGAQCTSVSGVYANGVAGTRLQASGDRAGAQGAEPGATGLAAASPANLDPAQATAGSIAAPPAIAAARSADTRTAPATPSPSTGPSSATPQLAGTATPPPSLRTSPRILRLWVAPWEDSDGDLHEASTVNVLVDHGRWLVERVRPAPQGPRMGVSPPAQRAAPLDAAAPGRTPQATPRLNTPPTSTER